MKEDLLKETFFSELEQGAYQLTDIDSDINEEEKTIGTMNNLEKKIWSLANHKDKLAMMMQAKFNFENCSDAEKLILTMEFKSFKIKAEVLRDIMWILIKDRCNLWEDDITIGLRKGYTIVTFKKSAFQDLLNKLFSH